jgi:hypothetical protein
MDKKSEIIYSNSIFRHTYLINSRMIELPPRFAVLPLERGRVAMTNSLTNLKQKQALPLAEESTAKQ